MDDYNIVPVIVAAFIPVIVGFLYYNPKAFGTAWMNSLGMTEEELQKDFNMPVVMGVSLVLAFMLAFFTDALIEMSHKEVVDGALVYGSFHTFKHGALHGAMYGIFLAMPVLVTNGLFERKSWKNLLINTGYWVLTLALIGGLTDAWN